MQINLFILYLGIYTTIPKARPFTLYPNVFNYFLFKQTQFTVKDTVYAQVQGAWCLDNYTDAGDKMRQE